MLSVHFASPAGGVIVGGTVLSTRLCLCAIRPLCLACWWRDCWRNGGCQHDCVSVLSIYFSSPGGVLVGGAVAIHKPVSLCSQSTLPYLVACLLEV